MRTPILPLLAFVLLAAGRADATGFGHLAGTVSGSDGVAVPRAEVRLTRLDSHLGALSYSGSRSTRSDAAGRFEFPRLAPGTYLVDARDQQRSLRFPLRIRVNGGEPLPEVPLVLEKGAAIEGVVADERGRPLAGVGVAVGDGGLQAPDVEPVAVIDFPSGALAHLPEGFTYPRLPLAVTYTDAEGRFRLAPVLPSVRTSIRVGGLPPFHDTTVSGIVAPPGRAAFVEVRLQRGAAVLGRVADPDGVPVKGARVTLRAIEAQPDESAWLVLTRGGPRGDQGVDATALVVGEEGLFRFEGLREGRYLLDAEAPGRARAASPIVVLTRMGEVVQIDLEMAAGRTIDGVVAMPAGVPVPDGTTVEVVGDASFPATVFSFLERRRTPVGRDGRFRLEGLGDGPVDLRVECPGRPGNVLEGIVAGAQPVVMHLPPPSPRATLRAPPPKPSLAARAPGQSARRR